MLRVNIVLISFNQLKYFKLMKFLFKIFCILGAISLTSSIIVRIIYLYRANSVKKMKIVMKTIIVTNKLAITNQSFRSTFEIRLDFLR